MNIYYIAGYPISDELYHHRIKGQKWGIRRYQNDDGSLTDAGRERYGYNLGEYSTKNQSIIRKLVTGDVPLIGKKRYGEKLEQYYDKKKERAILKGKNDKAKKYEQLYEAQKRMNTDREIYMSRTSTGKLALQNMMLGFGADRYRVERLNGSSRGEAAITSIMNDVGDLVGLGWITAPITDVIVSKKRYGRATV